MKPALFNAIQQVRGGVLVTVLSTEGHTYKKRGAKALFSIHEDLPLQGNLGSLCADQEILRQCKLAHETGAPRVARIDTSNAEDIHFGYGTFCGGIMELLIEPVLSHHKETYREVADILASGGEVELRHTVKDKAGDSSNFVEYLQPPRSLQVFGATPLAKALTHSVRELPLRVTVCDWRQAHLDSFSDLPHVLLELGPFDPDPDDFVVLLSHSYVRDRDALERSLSLRCPYIGLLSSAKRRAALFEELLKRGISNEAIEAVHSPIGATSIGRSDGEIALSIAAELMDAMRNATLASKDRKRHALKIEWDVAPRPSPSS